MSNKGIKIHRYTQEELMFLKENSWDNSRETLTTMFNERFGTKLSLQAIKSTCSKRGFKCGNDGRYKKGNVPFCKGMSKEEWEGHLSETALKNIRKNQFKKGSNGRVDYPVGHELWRNGYLVVKYTDDKAIPCNKRWKPKHNWIWEQYHKREVPKGHIVIFKDGNITNFEINNLLLISRENHVRLAKWNAFGKGELTELYAKVARCDNLAIRKESEVV